MLDSLLLLSLELDDSLDEVLIDEPLELLELSELLDELELLELFWLSPLSTELSLLELLRLLLLVLYCSVWLDSLDSLTDCDELETVWLDSLETSNLLCSLTRGAASTVSRYRRLSTRVPLAL